MANILYKGLIGKEDVYWDTTEGDPATFTRRSSLGTVTMTKIPDVFKMMRTLESFGAIDDSGISDNTSVIQAALNSGRHIVVTAPNGGYYKITDELTASTAGTNLISYNKAEIRQATAGKAGIKVTESFGIKGVKLTGVQYASAVVAEKAIYVYGTDKDNYVSGVFIEDCELSNWGFAGVWSQFVSNFDFSGNKIENVNYAGIMGLSVEYGTAHKNNINNVPGTPNAYGIQFSRTEDDSITTHPRSSHITVVGNLCRTIPNWMAYGTHAGESITFANNESYGCKVGIGVSTSDNGSNVPTFAPLNVSISGNTLNSGVTDGSYSYGIFLTGAVNVQSATGGITGNVVTGYGDASNGNGCAIYSYDTDGLIINGNAIVRPGSNGILITTRSKGTQVTGNSIHDVFSEAAAVPSGIKCNGATSTINISGNSFTKGATAATYTYADGAAILVGNEADNDVRVGQNFINGVKYYTYDTGFKTARHEFASHATSGTDEDDLASLTIPGGTIGINGGVKIIAAGSKTDGANEEKTIKLYFGATAWTVISANQTVDDWRVEATIFNTATNVQIVSWVAYTGSAVTNGYETAAIDTTADVIVKVTGEVGGGGTDVISQNIFFIERL